MAMIGGLGTSFQLNRPDGRRLWKIGRIAECDIAMENGIPE